MSDVPIQVIVAAFQEEDGAQQALATLKEAKKEKLIKIDDAAVISKDDEGKIHIKDTEDVGGGKGAGFGAVVGGVIGLLGGPGGAILGAGVGAAVGGVVAKLYDGGFNDDRLKQIGESLQPNTSAIVAVVEHKWVADLEAELQAASAEVMTAEISADIAEQLKAGGTVAYSAISSEAGQTVDRVAVSETGAEFTELNVSDEGVEMIDVVAEEVEEAADEVVDSAEDASDEAAA